jgi:uncharacterized protein YbdZ (MbtH family)
LNVEGELQAFAPVFEEQGRKFSLWNIPSGWRRCSTGKEVFWM